MTETSYTRGDAWDEHYRGLTLHISAKEEMWWQQYNGEQRLHVADPPADLVDAMLELKPLGAQFRVTEQRDVIAKREDANEEIYEEIYVGRFEEPTELRPDGDEEFAVSLAPDDVEMGDLWPSVYDGARYSLTSADDIWWQNSASRQRHPVASGIPAEIANQLLMHKSEGGSFRITPWGDVITLIDAVPDPGQVKQQYANLPRVVQNIIQLRSDRGLDMLPVYIGSIDTDNIVLDEPRDLTAKINSSEWEDIEQWIDSLGPTGSAQDGIAERESAAEFDDDPEEWAEDTLERETHDE